MRPRAWLVLVLPHCLAHPPALLDSLLTSNHLPTTWFVQLLGSSTNCVVLSLLDPSSRKGNLRLPTAWFPHCLAHPPIYQHVLHQTSLHSPTNNSIIKLAFISANWPHIMYLPSHPPCSFWVRTDGKRAGRVEQNVSPGRTSA